jgi:hypothetical protein
MPPEVVDLDEFLLGDDNASQSLGRRDFKVVGGLARSKGVELELT